MPVDKLSLEDGDIDVWPEAQEIKPWVERSVRIARFADIDRYHPALIDRVLANESDPRFTKRWTEGVGGAKVYHPDRWDCPAAQLIHARALTLFRKVVESQTAAADIGWATIYRQGDFCMPHSHLRTLASIVYFLDMGDEVPEHPASGRFLFADPRLKVCCQQEAGRMTSPSAPKLKAGTMILFPGALVHCVNPYFGRRPRITMSWNLNKAAIAGETLPGFGDLPLAG